MAKEASAAPLFIPSALGRAGYGASAEDAARVRKIGFPAWLDEQLGPREEADPACRERLDRLALRIKYAGNEQWPAVDQARPPPMLGNPIDAPWPLIPRPAQLDG